MDTAILREYFVTAVEHRDDPHVLGPLALWVLTAILLLLVLRKSATKARRLRRQSRRLTFTRDCVLSLLSKSTASVHDTLDLQSFLRFYTDYTAQSLRAQSAAFFRYHRAEQTVHAEAVVGVFPTLLNAPQEKMASLITSPARMQDYLHKTSFAVAETPLVEAITQERPIVFDEREVDIRVRYRVYDCWGMLLIPLIANDTVYGVLALANKVERQQFTEEDLQLGANLSEMAGIAVSHILSFRDLEEKRRMDGELENAAIILQHLLPQQVPSGATFELATHYRPAHRLGGDYYDFVHIDAEHLGLLVADVSGKGTPAGLVMATTRSLFSVLAQHELSPTAVLRKLNTQLLKLIPEEMFVTASYAILNTTTGELVWARAGHEPIICCSIDAEPRVLSTGQGMVIGMVEDSVFRLTLEDERCPLQEGDVVLLYTDGLTEAHSMTGEEFRRRRVVAMLKNVCGLSAREAMDCIVHRVERFVAEAPIYDDMTLVLIKLKRVCPATPEPETRHLN
jgi:sigma-B regulation protein RsbU (phosphoserine phosphatase)